MEKHFPDQLLYTKDHEWCSVQGDVATIGITWHAQDQLGDVVYCELPSVGASVEQHKTFGVVESVKAVSDLYAPVSGKVVARNEAILGAPEGLNEDCYGKGWMIKVQLRDPKEVEGLLSRAAYVALLESA